MGKKIHVLPLVTGLLLAGTMSIVIPMSGIMASANSAQTYWESIDATGAVVMDEECPIEVQHEKLVFDIPQFPSSYYQNVEDFVAYNASVSATYTFYNPADYTVKATLAFPFGALPYYAPYDYDDETGERITFLDTKKYNITIDGEEIEKKFRYTLSYSYNAFDIAEALPYLGNTYIEDDFYKMDTPVTKYCYEVSGIPEEHRSAYAYFSHTCDPAKTRIWFQGINGRVHEDEQVALGSFVQNGDVIIIYVLGEELPYTPDWTVSENGSRETEIAGSIIENVDKRDVMTFEEFAFLHYFGEYSKQTTNISEVDWYNAVVQSLNDAQYEYGFIDYYGIYDEIERRFMRWYQYDIEIPAKGTIVNTVTAPIYPSINNNWVPSIYGYTYLTSPAKTWSKFGGLDIEINTPYYLVKDTYGFTKTETGYTLSLDGLPEKELEFTLSSDENPQKLTNQVKSCLTGCAIMILAPISYLATAAGCNSVIGACVTYAPIGLTAIALFFKKRK